jgi:hypothetical protein
MAELTEEQIAARAARRLERLAAAAGIETVVMVEDVLTQRTTTVIDVSVTDLQDKVVNLDAQIESTVSRYVEPLRKQRRAVAKIIETLEAEAAPVVEE